jgi:hypothetical protein
MSTSDNSDAKVVGLVESAIRLGWRMAQVYHRPPPSEPEREVQNESLPPADHLPGLRELGDYERGKTLIAEIQHTVEILEDVLAFNLLSKEILLELAGRSVEPVETRRKLLVIHRELHRELAAQDPRFAKAFDLGRMLADTVLLSDPEKPEALLREFKHFRLGNAYQWLNDLHSLLPEQASYGVAGSLKRWEEWVRENEGIVPADASSQSRFIQTLHNQGETWRQLLCGEKAATDFLDAKSYKHAGDQVAKHFLNLLLYFVWGWKYVIALFGVSIAGVGYEIVKHSQGHSIVAAVITTVTVTLGISWKTLASTLGRVIENAEKPLWVAEVKEAIVAATTITPQFKTR